MRLVRFRSESGEVVYGLDLGDGRAEIVGGFVAASGADSPATGLVSAESLVPTGKICPFSRPVAPIDPANVFCIGLNYAEHAAETGADRPEHPVVFMKPTSAVISPGEPIRLPRVCEYEVDYEGELAVIIGRAGRDIAENDALDHVFGYTIANDVSARTWQKHKCGGQFVRGKSFDTFCPLGPAIVTARPMHDDDIDFIADPQNLQLTTRLNGETVQAASTGHMIFSVAKLISFLSCDTTLLPGTIILTGTPSGVGIARKPKRLLEAGDEVSVTIDRIGTLTNTVVDASCE